MKFPCYRVENIVGKGENAGYQHFLLFPRFQRVSSPRMLKFRIVWERVKAYCDNPMDNFLHHLPNNKILESLMCMKNCHKCTAEIQTAPGRDSNACVKGLHLLRHTLTTEAYLNH